MAEMRIGYGSEYQLLRYLGHHREYLNKEILKALKGVTGSIKWLDYPVDIDRDSMDGEYKNVVFLKNRITHAEYKQIQKNWKCYWPQRGNSQNWDSIFMINNKYYLVEAKAHLSEAHQECGAKEDSRNIIARAFTETCGKEDLAKQWLNSDCYQLANRLAFINFCEQNKIDAELLYICFVNGYRINPEKNVKDKIDWEEELEKEFKTLELDDRLRSKINVVCIDCLEPKSL